MSVDQTQNKFYISKNNFKITSLGTCLCLETELIFLNIVTNILKLYRIPKSINEANWSRLWKNIQTEITTV